MNRTVYQRFSALEAGVDGLSHLSRMVSNALTSRCGTSTSRDPPNIDSSPQVLAAVRATSSATKSPAVSTSSSAATLDRAPYHSEGQCILQNNTTNFLSQNGVRDWLQSGVSSEPRVHDCRQIETSF